MFFFLIIIFLVKTVFSAENFVCITKGHNGLNYLGGEYKEILDYLGLRKFKISISRDRKQIYENERSMLDSNQYYIPKNSHFIELMILKSDGNLYVMNCSWLFNINKDSINDGAFNCLEKSAKKAMFSLDNNLNFIYSSKFLKVDRKKNRNVYHSLLGSCEKSK